MHTKRTEPVAAVVLSDFDAAEFLVDEATIAAYIATVADEGSPVELDKAMATIARARSMNAAGLPKI